MGKRKLSAVEGSEAPEPPRRSRRLQERLRGLPTLAFSEYSGETLVGGREQSRDEPLPPEQEGLANPILFWTREFRWPRGYAGEMNFKPPNDEPPRDKNVEAIAREQMPGLEKHFPYGDPSWYDTFKLHGCSLQWREVNGGTVIVLPDPDLRQRLTSSLRDPPKSIRRQARFLHPPLHGQWTESTEKLRRDYQENLVPSIASFKARGNKLVEPLWESVDEVWRRCIPMFGLCPQPDYAVGYHCDTFTQKQLRKLSLLFERMEYRQENRKRNILVIKSEKSPFMATDRMLFPFLASECRMDYPEEVAYHNAHSMALAVKAVVTLFSKVGRLQELHRKILAFSISYSYKRVSIFGHYAEVEADGEVKYYVCPVRKFLMSFVNQFEALKWMPYRFVRSVYEKFAPAHLRFIKRAINQLLDSGFPPDHFYPAKPSTWISNYIDPTAPESEPSEYKERNSPDESRRRGPPPTSRSSEEESDEKDDEGVSPPPPPRPRRRVPDMVAWEEWPQPPLMPLVQDDEWYEEDEEGREGDEEGHEEEEDEEGHEEEEDEEDEEDEEGDLEEGDEEDEGEEEDYDDEEDDDDGQAEREGGN